MITDTYGIELQEPYETYRGWAIRIGYYEDKYGFFATKNEDIIPLSTQNLDFCVDILREALSNRCEEVVL